MKTVRQEIPLCQLWPLLAVAVETNPMGAPARLSDGYVAREIAARMADGG